MGRRGRYPSVAFQAEPRATAASRPIVPVVRLRQRERHGGPAALTRSPRCARSLLVGWWVDFSAPARGHARQGRVHVLRVAMLLMIEIRKPCDLVAS